jgi:LuxR family maltose regulon positive regulatory protein
VAVSDLLIRLRAIEQAIEFLALASQHPASERLTKIRAEQTLARVGSKLPASKFAEVTAAAKVLDPYAAALALREEFGIGGAEGRFAAVQSESDTDRVNQFLNDSLSERELEILRLLAEGLTNQQIAERLILVVGTVKAHNHHIFDKLGVSNRVKAITRARELGLL